MAATLNEMLEIYAFFSPFSDPQQYAVFFGLCGTAFMCANRRASAFVSLTRRKEKSYDDTGADPKQRLEQNKRAVTALQRGQAVLGKKALDRDC